MNGALDGWHPLRGPSYISIPSRYCTEGGPYKPHMQNHRQPEVTCEYNAGRSPASERPAIDFGGTGVVPREMLRGYGGRPPGDNCVRRLRIAAARRRAPVARAPR